MAKKEQIIEAIEQTPPAKLYASKIIAHKTTDTGESYSDVIAQYLLEHPSYFDAIEKAEPPDTFTNLAENPWQTIAPYSASFSALVPYQPGKKGVLFSHAPIFLWMLMALPSSMFFFENPIIKSLWMNA